MAGHSSVCVDENGKVECVCGLDDSLWVDNDGPTPDDRWSSIEDYDRERDDELTDRYGDYGPATGDPRE